MWREVAGSATWLRHPDRGLMELYCKLLHQQRSDFAEMPAARLVLLVNLGARLGLAPIDRTRLTLRPEPRERKNPFDEFGDPPVKLKPAAAK